MIQTAVLSAVEDVLGYDVPKKGKDWFDEECERALRERNKAWMSLCSNSTALNKEYNYRMKKDLKRLCRLKKREY